MRGVGWEFPAAPNGGAAVVIFPQPACSTLRGPRRQRAGARHGIARRPPLEGGDRDDRSRSAGRRPALNLVSAMNYYPS